MRGRTGAFAQDDESVWEVGGDMRVEGGRPVWDGAVKKCRGGGGVWEVQGKRGKEEEEGREGS